MLERGVGKWAPKGSAPQTNFLPAQVWRQVSGSPKKWLERAGLRIRLCLSWRLLPFGRQLKIHQQGLLAEISVEQLDLIVMPSRRKNICPLCWCQ